MQTLGSKQTTTDLLTILAGTLTAILGLLWLLSQGVTGVCIGGGCPGNTSTNTARREAVRVAGANTTAPSNSGGDTVIGLPPGWSRTGRSLPTGEQEVKPTNPTRLTDWMTNERAAHPDTGHWFEHRDYCATGGPCEVELWFNEYGVLCSRDEVTGVGHCEAQVWQVPCLLPSGQVRVFGKTEQNREFSNDYTPTYGSGGSFSLPNGVGGAPNLYVMTLDACAGVQ